MKRAAFSLSMFALFAFGGTYVFAKGVSSSAVLSLFQAPGARAAALGEAYSAASDDVTAFEYNPSALNTLSSGQASFLYEKGFADDNYGHYVLGLPVQNRSLGVSLSYYNGGEIELFDGVNTRNVTAKRDLAASVGYAKSIGRYSVGVAGKYISSQIAETYKTSAVAGDVGANMSVNERFKLGLALQNFGTSLKYVHDTVQLPRIARLGSSTVLFKSDHPTTFLFDVPYYLNEQHIYPSLGIETLLGPLALRMGYRTRNDLGGFSMGTGFFWGNSSLDYAFDLVKDLNAVHRVSFNFKFNGPNIEAPAIAQSNEEPWFATKRRAVHRVYVIKKGDTLQKIARQMYGNEEQWAKIFFANPDTLRTTTDLSAQIGKKIIIPEVQK